MAAMAAMPCGASRAQVDWLEQHFPVIRHASRVFASDSQLAAGARGCEALMAKRVHQIGRKKNNQINIIIQLNVIVLCENIS